MTDKFRERVFVDVGKPELQEKCLAVIDELKLLADNLTKDNKFALKQAEKEYDKWYEGKNALKSDGGDGEPKKDNNPLVTVDMTEHLEQQNKEMIDMLKKHMMAYINTKDKEMKRFVSESIEKSTGDSVSQIDSIEKLIIGN